MRNSSGVNHAEPVSNFAETAAKRWKRAATAWSRVSTLQLRVAIEPVLELADLVVVLVGLEQLRGALAERSLQGDKRVHARVEPLHVVFPGLPARVDGGEVPAEFGRDLGAVARRRLRGERGGGHGGGAQGTGDGDGHLDHGR